MNTAVAKKKKKNAENLNADVEAEERQDMVEFFMCPLGRVLKALTMVSRFRTKHPNHPLALKFGRGRESGVELVVSDISLWENAGVKGNLVVVYNRSD